METSEITSAKMLHRHQTVTLGGVQKCSPDVPINIFLALENYILFKDKEIH